MVLENPYWKLVKICRQCFIFYLTDYTLNTWCVWWLPFASLICVVSFLVIFVLLAVLGPLHLHTIKPFLPSFLSWFHSHEKRYQALSHFTVRTIKPFPPSFLTHVRKDTRPSPALLYCKQWKAGWWDLAGNPRLISKYWGTRHPQKYALWI